MDISSLLYIQASTSGDILLLVLLGLAFLLYYIFSRLWNLVKTLLNPDWRRVEELKDLFESIQYYLDELDSENLVDMSESPRRLFAKVEKNLKEAESLLGNFKNPDRRKPLEEEYDRYVAERDRLQVNYHDNGLFEKFNSKEVQEVRVLKEEQERRNKKESELSNAVRSLRLEVENYERKLGNPGSNDEEDDNQPISEPSFYIPEQRLKELTSLVGVGDSTVKRYEQEIDKLHWRVKEAQDRRRQKSSGFFSQLFS